MPNSSTIPVIEISTLPEYIEKIRRLPKAPHLFRGQGQDYPLQPKIARLKAPLNETVESMERIMLADLKRRAGAWFKDSLLRPDNDWDWLALAQHHGIATRLLDWSDNPLTALFFAVEKPFEPKKAPGAKCPVVWMFRVEEDEIIEVNEKEQKMTPFNTDRTRVFRPNHVTPRIVAQNGWFTVHPLRAQKDKYHGFLPLEKNPDYKSRLTKFQINANCVGELRRILRTCGVHVGSIYPDLQGLCADITERFTHQSDEAQDTIPLRDDFDMNSIDDNDFSIELIPNP